MADPKAAPTTDMATADAANGEPDALDQTESRVNRARGEARQGGVEHPTGDKQAERNRQNEPPA